MRIYESGLDDVRVHRLWEQMMLSGDIKSFPACLLSLTTFLNTMQPPTTLLFEEDDSGIWFAMWMEPATWDFGTLNLWVRDGMRHSRAALAAVNLALHHCFTKVTMVMVYAIDPQLMQEYVHFGLELRGLLPKIADGEDAYLLTLTAEQFAVQQAPALVGVN